VGNIIVNEPTINVATGIELEHFQLNSKLMKSVDTYTLFYLREERQSTVDASEAIRLAGER